MAHARDKSREKGKEAPAPLQSDVGRPEPTKETTGLDMAGEDLIKDHTLDADVSGLTERGGNVDTDE